MNKKINLSIFSVNNFIYASVLIILLNSVAWFKLSSYSQMASILLAAYGIISVSLEVIRGTWSFDFPFWKISLGIVLSSLLSLIFNDKQFIIKNVYSLLSVFINFFIFFSIVFNRKEDKLISNVLKIAIVFTLISAVLNLVLYFGNMSFSLVDYVDVKDSQFIGLDPIRHRFNGLSGNANGLSRLSIVSIMSGFAFVKLNNIRYNKLFLLIVLLLNVPMIYISQSRGSVMVYSLFLIVYGVSSFTLDKFKDNNFLKVIITVAVVGVLFIGSVWATPTVTTFILNTNRGSDSESGGVIDRHEDDEIIKEDVSNGRFTLIKNGVEATLDRNPLFGLSYSGNAIQVREYLDENNIKVPYYIYNGAGSMHNTIVQSFVNNGLIGLVFLVMFLFIQSYGIIKLNLQKSISKANLSNLALVNGIFVSLMLLNMVEWIFYFDFDNHFLNLVLLVSFGWISKKMKEVKNYE